MPGAGLIGRERELTALAGMLSDPGMRLVTVTGPAGVGKTRVAYAVAEAMAPDASGPALHVDLTPRADPGLVADRSQRP